MSTTIDIWHIYRLHADNIWVIPIDDIDFVIEYEILLFLSEVLDLYVSIHFAHVRLSMYNLLRRQNTFYKLSLKIKCCLPSAYKKLH